MVIGGAVTDAKAGAARGGHAHAAPASQIELLENYGKLTAALDAMATHDSAVVEAALKSGRPTLLVFIDRGCVACLRMIPVVANLQKEFELTVEIVVVDTDDKGEGFRKLYRRFSVWAGPAFVVLNRSGKPVQRLIGPQPESSLRARLTALTGESRPAPNQERRTSHSPVPIAPSPHRTSGTPTP
jgi:thiol-disulfide isomerase/thioredoxin